MVENPSNVYWLALGRFINCFSNIEQSLHTYLWMLSQVEVSVLRAILPDARMNNVVSAINKIIQSRADTEHPLYRRAVEQIGIISKVRNQIVHYPSGLTDKGLLISNAIKAMPGKAVEATVTIQTIDDMSEDCIVIGACIAALITERANLPPDAKPIPWERIAQTPWRYKQPSQSASVHKRHERIPKPRPQPKPSHQ